MNLDERVDMLTDEQANSLKPIFDILEKDEKQNYLFVDGEYEYHIPVIKPFSTNEEEAMIKAYNSNHGSDKNYKIVMEEALDETMERNSQSASIHFIREDLFFAMYYMRRNFRIQKIIEKGKSDINTFESVQKEQDLNF